MISTKYKPDSSQSLTTFVGCVSSLWHGHPAHDPSRAIARCHKRLCCASNSARFLTLGESSYVVNFSGARSCASLDETTINVLGSVSGSVQS